MKMRLIVCFLLLSSVFVSADLSVSCQEKSDCILALGNEAYTCVDSVCQKGIEQEDPVIVLEPKQKNVEWGFVILEEKKDMCSSCFSFAPEQKRDVWWKNIFDFMIYL